MSDSQSYETEELTDDTAVGKALAGSAVVLLLAGLAGVAFWLLRPGETSDLAAEADAPALPDIRPAPELELPLIPFREITEAAGIDFVHVNGAAGEKLLPETMSGGCAFLDFDSDGDQDLLLVNSCHWPWTDAEKKIGDTRCRLYANNGTGSFTDVTADSGLEIPDFYGNGVACGDINNDGLTDVYLTAVGQNRLMLNEGDGKFSDITARAGCGAGDRTWSTSAGFFDYDSDGDLDLFVCNYVEWSRELDQSMEFTLDGTLRAYGRPTDFRGVCPVLFRNDGGLDFTDVSAETGIQVLSPDTGEPLAKSLGLAFWDVNDDNRLDVLIANDTVQNLLLINDAGRSFSETGATSGFAFDNDGSTRGAMGIDAGCFRNSDAVGVTIGNFANEMTALYVNQTPGIGTAIFRDEAVSNGIGPVTRVELTFGVLFADMDLDGRLDIVAGNGHLEEDIAKVQSSQQYEQPPQLLWNCGPEHECEFTPLSEHQTSADFHRRMVGRAVSRADIDGDGDLDLLLMSSGGPPRLLRNDQAIGHNWLRLKLEGTTDNRDAIGAVVRVTTEDGITQTRLVNPTCGYQSQSELPLTFGLGENTAVTRITVNWPDGTSQDVTTDALNTTLQVVQKSSSE